MIRPTKIEVISKFPKRHILCRISLIILESTFESFLTSISASTKKDFAVNRMYIQTWQQLETWVPYKLRSVCLLLSISQQNAIKMCIATRWDKSENSNQHSFQYNVTRGIYFSIENLSATKFRMWQSMIL